MRIPCPHCGERSLDEFVYQGDASIKRPDATTTSTDEAEAFYEYGYLRSNQAGSHEELWFHNAGCHAWLVVTRDVRTHEIFEVRLARDVAQERNRTVEGAAA